MKTSFTTSDLIPSDSSTLYHAWLNSTAHSAMTGGEAECSEELGAAFTAWDGYIQGSNVSLSPVEEIVQRWRTDDFNEEDEDSVITVHFKDTADGCLLTLTHTQIPDGQPDYKQGWDDHYFTPMKQYFEKP